MNHLIDDYILCPVLQLRLITARSAAELKNVIYNALALSYLSLHPSWWSPRISLQTEPEWAFTLSFQKKEKGMHRLPLLPFIHIHDDNYFRSHCCASLSTACSHATRLCWEPQFRFENFGNIRSQLSNFDPDFFNFTRISTYEIKEFYLIRTQV